MSICVFRFFSDAITAGDDEELHLALAAWALLLALGNKQQVAFQQLYLNAQSSRGTSGQRKIDGWVSTNIRCVTVCHILHDLHGMPNTGWWHHVAMPMCNIPVKKNFFGLSVDLTCL